MRVAMQEGHEASDAHRAMYEARRALIKRDRLLRKRAALDALIAAAQSELDAACARQAIIAKEY